MPVAALAWAESVTEYSWLSQISPSITVTLTPSRETSIFVVGVEVAVMWESTDLSILLAVTKTAEPTTGSTNAAQTSYTNTLEPTTASTNAAQTSYTNTLNSPGTIAAIILGAVIAAALIGSLWWWRVRRKRNMKPGGCMDSSEINRTTELDSSAVRPIAELES